MHDVTDHGPSGVKLPEVSVSPNILQIENLTSPFEELSSLFDFISSNGIPYDTMGESIRRFVRENEQNSPDKSKELKNTWNELVGDHVSIERSYMIYLDINNKISEAT